MIFLLFTARVWSRQPEPTLVHGVHFKLCLKETVLVTLSARKVVCSSDSEFAWTVSGQVLRWRPLMVFSNIFAMGEDGTVAHHVTLIWDRVKGQLYEIRL